MMRKSIVSASLNGVLTDPVKFNIPVHAKELAIAAKQAYDEGATIVHVHFRDPKNGSFPTWEPRIAKDIADEIRSAVPNIVVNFTTGTFSKSLNEHMDLSFCGGPLGEVGVCH